MGVKDIHIEAYDYDLPDERIAKFPLPKRDESKLLVFRNNQIEETQFLHLTDYLPQDSLLVFNNTKVIQARLHFRKETGAQIEILCLEPKQPTDYAQSFAQNRSCSWLCLVGNSKRWKSGKLECIIDNTVCTAERLEQYEESSLVRFEWDNPDLSFADILERAGELPIPPYLNRRTEESDKETYQTVYSKIKGSVAAPTAGLHFTPEVFESLAAKHIGIEELTLHVGAGTFKPVKTDTLEGHEMHTECFSVKRSTIENLIKNEGKVIAVGTTSVRTLESLYYIGLAIKANPQLLISDLTINQWEPYDTEESGITPEEALGYILQYMEKNDLEVITSHTQILIAPGYDFKIVNGMITNFHQPKSTLLLLISAFVGEQWKEIYDYAMMHEFRFLSYGDSMLLLATSPQPPPKEGVGGR